MRASLDQIVIDSEAPSMLVRFWAALLGGDPVDRAGGWSHVEPPGFPRLSFQPVLEAKMTKNRLHLDIEVAPGEIPSVAVVAERLGAKVISRIITGELGSCQVLADPEGNEFCFVCD